MKFLILKTGRRRKDIVLITINTSRAGKEKFPTDYSREKRKQANFADSQGIVS
ncbi:MAG TPA: hypothetical protein VK469_00735 [Candidatus Kapabacteria bacterium]|nr:hypothetical protein [Candidatus Kapabacteria bacterium]